MLFCFFSWYFGKVSRQASEDWLLSPGYPKGTYLVRQGEAAPDTYTLSVRDCDELRGYIVKHYKIHTQRDPQIAFQNYFITPRKRFRTLDELVNHYSGVYLYYLPCRKKRLVHTLFLVLFLFFCKLTLDIQGILVSSRYSGFHRVFQFPLGILVSSGYSRFLWVFPFSLGILVFTRYSSFLWVFQISLGISVFSGYSGFLWVFWFPFLWVFRFPPMLMIPSHQYLSGQETFIIEVV